MKNPECLQSHTRNPSSYKLKDWLASSQYLLMQCNYIVYLNYFNLAASSKCVKKSYARIYSFVAEEWGPCSVTCGEGVRKRKVYCKAHLDYTKIMTKFTDDTCSGTKPEEEEPCKLKTCSSDSG